MGSLGFWLAAAALIAAALAFLLPTLLRTRTGRGWRDSSHAANAAAYRARLAELQAEAARGELDAAQLAAAEEELQRQLLEDAQHAPARTRRSLPAWAAASAVAVALPLFAIALYFVVGTPQGAAEAPAPGGADYVAQLRRHLERQPGDVRGWVLLARAQAEREDFAAAAAAYERAISAPRSRAARDPTVLTEYADVLGMAQGGRLAGRPAELVAEALAIDPQHPAALEMAGSAAYEAGRYADTLRHWQALLAQLPAGSPRHRELQVAIERVRSKQGVAPG